MSDAMIVRRGGGVKLNFRINQYAPDTDLSNFIGKTNEIAVLTATPIPDWSIGMTEPLVPTVGSVWVKTGTSARNSMNALKKNGIVLNLQGVYQYVTGAWSKRKAYIWQSGQWNDLDIFLFDNGDQCTDLTGGWQVFKQAYCSHAILDTYIRISHTSNSSLTGFVSTTDAVDMKGYTTLKARITNIQSTGDQNGLNRMIFCLLNALPVNGAWDNNSGKVVTYVAIPQNQAQDFDLALNISAYKAGSYRVGFYSCYTQCHITEIWFE